MQGKLSKGVIGLKYTDEIWKEIPETNAEYEVSNYGNVRSVFNRGTLSRNRSSVLTGRILKQQLNTKGYSHIKISGKMYPVHRLVIKAFMGDSDLQVNHKDFNKLNNHISNLEYVSLQENVRHANEAGRNDPYLNPNMRRKLTPDVVNQIREDLKGMSTRRVAFKYGIGKTTVHQIKIGGRWKDKFQIGKIHG